MPAVQRGEVFAETRVMTAEPDRPVDDGATAPPCEHGYAAPTDCPRCGVGWSAPPRRVVETTRWYGSTITMGPVGKVLFTLALALPALVCLYGLSLAGNYEGNVFFALPLGVLLLAAAVMLPEVWERTRRS